MGTSRALTAAAIVTAVVVLLCGCDSGGSPGAVDTPQAAHSPSSAGPPATVVRVSCLDLVPLASIRALLGADATAVDHTAFAYSNLADFSLEQAGGEACAWGGGGAHVSAEVLPAASTEWAALSSLLTSTTDTGEITTTNPVYGDASFLNCTPPGFGYTSGCFFDSLVHGYWLHLELAGTDAVAEPAVSGQRIAILQAAVAAVGRLGAPAHGWTPPAGSLVAPASCTGLVPLSVVQRATGSSQLTEAFDSPGTQLAASIGAIRAAGGLYCDWAAPAGAELDVTVLPGGSWAWSGANAPPPDNAYRDDGTVVFSRVTLAGAAAWGACSPIVDQCFLDVIVNHSWIHVGGYADATISADQLVPVAQAVIAQTSLH